MKNLIEKFYALTNHTQSNNVSTPIPMRNWMYRSYFAAEQYKFIDSWLVRPSVH